MPVTIDLYTLSLHDALPISVCQKVAEKPQPCVHREPCGGEHLLNGCAALRLSMGSDFGEFEERLLHALPNSVFARSEEHTSELQSRQYLVCRLLLEKKKKHK